MSESVSLGSVPQETGVGAFGIDAGQIGGPGMDSEKVAPSSGNSAAGTVSGIVDRLTGFIESKVGTPEKAAATGINLGIALSPLGVFGTAVSAFGKAVGFATGLDMPTIGDIAVEAGMAIARGDVTPSKAGAQADAEKRDASKAGEGNYFTDPLFVGSGGQTTQSAGSDGSNSGSPLPSAPSQSQPILPSSGGRNPYRPIIPTLASVGAIWL